MAGGDGRRGRVLVSERLLSDICRSVPRDSVDLAGWPMAGVA
jgi:hypothetical protein